MSTPDTFSTQALLEHQEFLRTLARSLLADESSVDDVLQETWIAAWTRPPRTTESLRAWLARAVHNRALNWRRGEAHRLHRERSVARAEAASESEDVDARLRAQRRVVDAVLALKEPYKTAVYLRWCDGHSPREIARRENVPLETIRTRLKRGLEMLRRKLDAEFGDRRAWSAALAPLLIPRPVAILQLSAWSAIAGVIVAAVLSVAVFARSPASGFAALARASESPSDAGSSNDSWTRLDAGSRRTAIAPAAATSPAAPTSPDLELPLRVHALDARTREQLAAVRVRAVRVGTTREAEHDEWTTDEAGVGASTEAFALARTRLEFEDVLDGHSIACLASRVRRDGASFELECELDVGPTFLLALDPRTPVGLENLRFVLAHPGETTSALVARAHAGPTPWVRFAALPPASLVDHGGRSELALRAQSDDGLLAAESLVPARYGMHREPITIALEPRARVDGRVEDFHGHAIEAAELTIISADSQRLWRANSEHDGSFELAWLPAGECRLSVRSPRHEPDDRALCLHAGAPLQVGLRLGDRATTSIEGSLASRTGASVPLARVHLRSTSDPSLAFETESMRTAGEMASFRFEGVPLGEYEVWPALDAGFAWDPPSLLVAASCTRASFTCRDDEIPRAIAFRVLDAETGARLESFRVAVLIDRNRVGKRRAAQSEPRVDLHAASFGADVRTLVPPGLEAWWLVECEGYRSAYGRLSDLRWENGRYLGDLRLERSWSADFWVGTRDESGREIALPGAHIVTSAHRTLATSLADGQAHLDLVFDPGRVDIELEGWHVASIEGFARGKLRTPIALHHVWMERESGSARQCELPAGGAASAPRAYLPGS